MKRIIYTRTADGDFAYIIIDEKKAYRYKMLKKHAEDEIAVYMEMAKEKDWEGYKWYTEIPVDDAKEKIEHGAVLADERV